MLNKASLIGRVGKKDYKQVKNGSYMTTLSIATNRKFVDSTGASRQETTWHTVNFFNKIADVANKYTHVGDVIYIEGEISHREITDNNNNKRWIYSITGSELKLLPQSRKKEDVDDNGNLIKDMPESMIEDFNAPF